MMFEYKRKAFWSFKGFIFCWRMIFVWSLWLWSKSSSFMDFWWKSKFFGRLKILFFIDISVWDLWLWSKPLSFMGFLMKKEYFFGVWRFSFLFRVLMFEYLCFFMVARKIGCEHILKMFSFWMSSGWVGWLFFVDCLLTWICCFV